MLLALFLFKARAQHISPDLIPTSKGELSIQPVNHASLVLSTNGITVYADPVGGAAKYKGLASPDIIVVTDIHGDHFDINTIDSIEKSSTVLVVPKAVADKIPAAEKAKIIVLKNGDEISQSGVSIRAIPMYNLPESPDAKHTKGRGNGYVIRMADKNIYLSGDTDGIPEMRSLKDIDIAFVCMNPPYTMDYKQAADAVLALKPKIIYPYHYRGQNGFSDVNDFKKLVEAGNKSIEVRLRNWYAG